MDNIIEEELNEKKPEKRGLKNVVVIAVLLIISFSGAFLVGKTFLKNDSNNEVSNKLGPLFETREFTVNLANSNGRRFLKAQFSIELNEKKVVEELEGILPVFEDKVIMVLSTQTMENLNSANGREKIKNQLIENINHLLTTGEVKNIYFSNFVWQ